METIFRRGKRQNRFSIVSNDLIQDARVSWKARGIMVYMLSMPDDWEVHLSEIMKHSEKDGRDAFSSWIRELEKYGYIQRLQEKDDKGKFLPMVYEISEIAELWKEKTPAKPSQEHVEPQTGFPSTDEPQTGEPLTGNPLLQNTDSTKTDSDKDLLYRDIFDFWNDENILVHKKLTPLMEKAIKKSLATYTPEEIETGIKNYADILHSPDTFFTYKWTLAEFLSRENGLAVFFEKTIENYKKEVPDAEKQKNKEISNRIKEQKRVDEINEKEQKRRVLEEKKKAADKSLQEDARRWFYSLAAGPYREKIEAAILAHPLMKQTTIPTPPVPDENGNISEMAKSQYDTKRSAYNYSRRVVEDTIIPQFFST